MGYGKRYGRGDPCVRPVCIPLRLRQEGNHKGRPYPAISSTLTPLKIERADPVGAHGRAPLPLHRWLFSFPVVARRVMFTLNTYPPQLTTLRESAQADFAMCSPRSVATL